MMTRREFMRVLAAASVVSAVWSSVWKLADFSVSTICLALGNVHFLHFTDCHANFMPIYFREPSVNMGVGSSINKVPHVVGENFLREFAISP